MPVVDQALLKLEQRLSASRADESKDALPQAVDSKTTADIADIAETIDASPNDDARDRIRVIVDLASDVTLDDRLAVIDEPPPDNASRTAPAAETPAVPRGDRAKMRFHVAQPAVHKPNFDWRELATTKDTNVESSKKDKKGALTKLGGRKSTSRYRRDSPHPKASPPTAPEIPFHYQQHEEETVGHAGGDIVDRPDAADANESGAESGVQSAKDDLVGATAATFHALSPEEPRDEQTDEPTQEHTETISPPASAETEGAAEAARSGYLETCQRMLSDLPIDSRPVVILASDDQQAGTDAIVAEMLRALTEQCDDPVVAIDACGGRLRRQFLAVADEAADAMDRGDHWRERIVQTGSPGLCLLAIDGVGVEEGVPSAEQYLAELRAAFGLTVVDAGSLTIPHIQPFVEAAGGSFLLVRLGITTRKWASQTRDRISTWGSSAAGCVLTIPNINAA